MNEDSSQNSSSQNSSSQNSSSQNSSSQDSPSQKERGGEGEDLPGRLSKVYHDLNNSLSVISGNAQLLSEMARAEGLGPMFTDPLQDIEAARAEISEALQRLDQLREVAGEEDGNARGAKKER